MTKIQKCGQVAMAAAVIFCSVGAKADVIDFENKTGPSTFGAAFPSPQTLTYAHATFSGGVVLTAATGLPVNRTSVYGTADFHSGLLNPLTITFDHAVTNVFFDLLNGQSSVTSYLIADNAGNSQTFSLSPNTSSGKSIVGFAATGTTVQITSLSGPRWDFLIDNVHFDEELPPSIAAVPEPSTYALMFAGLGLTAFIARRRSRKTV